MPTWRNKPANRNDLNKRYTPYQQQVRRNAARAAVQRLYCDVLALWKGCPKKICKRQRSCMGEPAACLKRAWGSIPRHRHNELRDAVIAGGPRRIKPETHVEWAFRRYPSSSLT